jgi:hypothetical protein
MVDIAKTGLSLAGCNARHQDWLKPIESNFRVIQWRQKKLDEKSIIDIIQVLLTFPV